MYIRTSLAELVLALLVVSSVACSSFVDNEGVVPCVPGCFNEDCPETFDFCAEAHGSCRPVPCKTNADCDGLDSCDRGVTRSRKFVCDASGQCVRTPSPCPNNCGKGQPCPEPGELCFTMANQCKYCDIHRCFRDSDCDNLRKANPGIEFECDEMKCVVK